MPFMFFGFIQPVLVDLVGLYNYQCLQPAQFWWWWWRKYTEEINKSNKTNPYSYQIFINLDSSETAVHW